jgi:hypothetical protein
MEVLTAEENDAILPEAMDLVQGTEDSLLYWQC